MKIRRTLLAALALLPLLVQATVYYVSPSGSDTNNGTSTSTPWKTISKVNGMGSSLHAGDQVLFLRGGMWREKLSVPNSGSTSSKITFGAYGTGADPIISGSLAVTNWTLHSGNIWKATVSSAVKQVYFNGTMQTLARYPNAGWLRTDVSNSTSTTDAALTQGSSYWNGATMVLRTTNWSYDTAFVTANSGTTLTHTSTGNNNGAQQWGYFLRNKLSQLDAAGEWFYDKPTSTLYFWCPGNANPSGNLVEAAVQDFGIYFSYQRHDIIVTNLAFQHQIDASVRLSGTYNVEVSYCKMIDTQRAIYSTGATQNIHHNTIERNYQTAVYLLDNNSTFTYNTFTDICLWPGLGENNWGYFGLRCNGSGMTVSDNRFQNTGYIGMVIEQNTLAERNVVRNPLAILNDGGGIAIDNADGLVLRKNMVLDAVGNIESVAPEYTNFNPIAHGIYFGNISIKNTLVEYNTVAHCSKSGIHVDHTMVSTGNQIKNNTLFDNLYQLSISDYSNYNTPGASAPFYVPSFNTVYSGNIMYCMSKDQECMHQIHVYSATLVDFGTFSNNRYFNPYNELSIEIHNQTAGTREFFSMERFAAQFGEDAGSSRHPLRQDIYGTVSELSANLVVNGTFTTNVTGWGGFPYNSVISRDLTYLDNGALKAYLPNNSQYATLSLRNPDQFNVQNAQWYRLRFSIQSNIHGNLNAGVKGVSQLVNANTIFNRDVPFDTQRRDMEWYFQSTMTDQALVQFIHSYTQPQYWMDNVELHRVTVAPIDPTQQHIFYANDLATAQTYTLPSGCWKDVAGTLQGATVSVDPYSSKIFYRVTGTGCSAQQVDCAGTVGGSALPGTACNDNNACTTGDTWNSSCQCVGTSTSMTPAITAGGATSFCSGGSVVLSATTGTGYTYVWKKDGTTISGATASSYTASQSGVYSVVITIGGCANTSAGTTVTVTSAPTAAITAGGATTFCSGSSVALNASTGTGYTYVWKKDGTTISGATSSSYSATLAGSYTVVITSGGCAATSSAVTVTVNASPTATISAGGATSFCSGGSVVLSATTGTGYTFVWKKDGTTISGATGSSYTANVTGAYTVVTTNGSCSATSAATSVTVSAAPAATISAGGSTTFCSGSSVTLNASTGTGYTYVWKKNGTTVSGATSSSYSATTAGSYTVVVSNGGCSTTSTAIMVTVNPAPTATITAGGSTSFCTGGSVVLNANTGTGYTYVWKKDGTTISGATGTSYTASNSGTYTVVITGGGCSTTSAGATVTVSTVPTATITAAGSTAFCSGGSVVLNANTGAGLTYIWRRDAVTISGATSSSYTATLGGAYTVVVASGACSNTSAATTLTVKASPLATCSNNATNASVSVLASGGVTPYTYSWNTAPVQTAATATVTASGSYTATVTGANGCTASCTTTITLPSLNCTGTRTEAQGTWGATATAYNAAGYMANQWATAFPSPNYLTIGCGTRLVRFTTAAAVIAALPTYGTPAVLATGTAVNPASPANSFVGQIAALKLAVRFDELDPAFSTSDVLLKNMLVASGTFAGWTVDQLLTTAEQVIGGCSTSYPLATLSTALTNVNNGYQGGVMNSGYLACPGSMRMLWESNDEPVEEVMGISAQAFPNPFHDATTIVLSGLDVNERLSVRLFAMNGAELPVLFEGMPNASEQRIDWQVADHAQGMYFYQVVNGALSTTGKLMVE